jgi:hypothetical protein
MEGVEIMRTIHARRAPLAGLCAALATLTLAPQVWTGFSDQHHCAFWPAG